VRTCGARPADGSIPAVEYLAVAQMPERWSRRIKGTLFTRGYRLPRAWHAVPSDGSTPTALCGFRSTREPSRSWMQTMMPRRCSTCQRLIDEAEAKAIAMAEGLSPSVLDQPPVGLLFEGAGIHEGCG